jgi:hypothetical protein
VTAAAAELEHAFARRDQKSHELAIVLVIGGVEFAPTLGRIEIGLDALEQVPLSLTVDLRGDGGWRRIHQGLGK